LRNLIRYVLAFCFPLFASAQMPHPWEFGGGIGLGAYEGDLQESLENLQKIAINPSISAHIRHNVSNHFSASLGLLYTGLSGKDQNFKETDWRQARGFMFESPLVELSLKGEIYPFGLYKSTKTGEKGRLKTRRLVAPYAAIGIGGAFFKPKNDWNHADMDGGTAAMLIQQDIDEASRSSLSIPMELGFRFRISNKFTLGLAGRVAYTPNDYLDGVSASGNPDKTDWFYTLQAVASYAFGKPTKQKASRRPRDSEDKIPSADSDGDGVNDDKDECPDLPGLRSVKGCPDADRDGIRDADDLCPELAGLPTLSGCPDQDEDGIADKDDNCPEVKGVLAYRGCPAIDRDKDGVADAEDLCPDMSGQLRWKGCPDSDSDGIPDNKDACPGIAGPDHLRGCPDTDEDGVADKDDECPTIAGLAAKKGCPEAMPAAIKIPYKAIYFNSTLDDWQVTSLITLDEIVSIMTDDPSLFARIEGHTDNTGKEPANDLLAEKRAQKCRDNLATKGIAMERLNYIGLGSKKPTVPNDTREHRQLNRRVEIHFYKK